MSYNPIVIANAIIKQKKKLTIMELLKLQYIAHGYSLAILNQPLFKGKIEAWPYGPVIREVYNVFRTSQGIKILKPVPTISETIDKKSEEVIEAVLNVYKDKDGWELSALTHEVNSPWTITVDTKGFYSEIPDDLTQSHYKELIKKDND